MTDDELVPLYPTPEERTASFFCVCVSAKLVEAPARTSL